MNFIKYLFLYFIFLPLLLKAKIPNIAFQGDIITLTEELPLYKPQFIAEFLNQNQESFRINGKAVAFLGIDYKTLPGSYNLIIKDYTGKIVNAYPILILPGHFRDEKLNVNKKFIEYDEKTLARINRELSNLIRTYNSPPSKIKLSEIFTPPLKEIFITSYFASRRIYNNTKSGRHGGVDLRGWYGTKVFAINSGKVVLSADYFLTGRIIVIDHGNSIYSTYMHLNKRIAQLGAEVKRGELIGLVGATGRVTGPHLDLRLKIQGNLVNPMFLFTKANKILTE